MTLEVSSRRRAAADLLEQAQAAGETASLYDKTILHQTLKVDQQSYGQGKVEFDRVIRDLRSVLHLQFGYHRAIAQLATTLALIEQSIGTDLNSLPKK